MKLSIVIPIHDMKNGSEFLWRSINRLTEQTFQDFEIIITKAGKMAKNTNAGIKHAHGEYIKVLYLDDYLSSNDSLQEMMNAVEHIKPEWVICGAHNNLVPYWTSNIETGNNKLGSPSALLFKNHFEDNLLFDEKMSWLLDCDFYRRMYVRFGNPTILPGNYVTLGEGDHQMTHILTDEEKLSEVDYMNKKYA